jgi:hypothetical protein
VTEPPHDVQTTATAGAGRAALSRELSDFLIEFSIALHKHAIYPDGHPSLGPAVVSLTNRLLRLLEQRGSLSLGIARNQFVIEGVATDAKNPVLRDLAGRLHRHHLGAITFRRGVAMQEVRHALALLAAEADRTDQPLGVGPRAQLGQWEHLQLYPVSYERLELLDDEGAATDDDTRRQTRTRAAQLWIGLARAALAAEGAEAPELSKTEPTAVARAIDEHERGSAYDQVIVGYLLQMAEELRAGGGETMELKRRMSGLVQSLDQATLERLLEMGGAGAQRRAFLLSAAQGMSVDAVIDLVRAASEAERGQPISDSLLRMLQKLARHADAGGARRHVAESAVRDQVQDLIKDWSLNDPNPETYRKALSAMAGTDAGSSTEADVWLQPESKRLVHMALEIGMMGEPVERAVQGLIDEGEIAWLVKQLQDGGVPEIADAVWASLTAPARIQAVASAPRLDAEVLDALLERAGIAAAEALLTVLIESESAFARRLLLTRISGLGDAVGPLVVARLQGQPWYVQRNMLAILGELERLPENFSAFPYLQHTDPRVRREALRILMRQPDTRERALVTALTDADERNVRVGLQAALESCPETAVPLVVARATGEMGGEVKTLAIRVLGATRHPRGLEALLSLTACRKGLFGDRLPRKTEGYLAALYALHAFGDDARARAALAAAARAKDPDIAHAAIGEGA